jgi:transposase-like protein
MSASVARHPAAKLRDRSIAARRAARTRKFERERLIVDCLNRGVSVAEIARRIGVTEKRMRALVNEILVRRMPAAPEDFAALQVSRLNEALLVAWSAMSPDNLKAVALVVRIVRELDRYHGFAPTGRRPRRDGWGVEGEAREPFARAGDRREAAGQGPERVSRSVPLAASERQRAFVDAPAEAAQASAEAPADRPQKAPQALEKMESAPENDAPRGGPDDVVQRRGTSHSAVDARPAAEAMAPAVGPPRSDPAVDGPCDGAQTAPQAAERIDFAPGNGMSVAAAGATDGPSTPAQSEPRTKPIQLSHETIGRPEAVDRTATGMSMALDDWGGVRRLKVRFLPNGVAAC